MANTLSSTDPVAFKILIPRNSGPAASKKKTIVVASVVVVSLH